MNKNDWYNFQEKIKDYFLGLGCEAVTNFTLNGVRTEHDIDVYVTSKFLGQDLKWIIEAKKWTTKVSKLHVLALRTIVEETGSDKGFIISDKGFQKGAIEAARNTNVFLRTFDELKIETEDYLAQDILKIYTQRIMLILQRYHSHDRDIRIKYGLRGERVIPDGKFSVFHILFTAQKIINSAIDGKYPIDSNTHLNEQFGKNSISNLQQVVNWLNLNLLIAEEKLFRAEIEMQKDGVFDPSFAKFENDEWRNLFSKILSLPN